MSFNPVTLKSIARELNLSVSTVSKALRGSHEISMETQQLVRAFADQHNYRPNPIAQSLKKGRSKSLGVVVSNIDNNFFSQVINGIESVAHEKDYTVIITQSKESAATELKNIEHLSSRSIDGLIISISAETIDGSVFQAINKRGIPVVFVDRTLPDVAAHKVIANNIKGAYEATNYLLQQGFKNIAHITSSSHLSISLQRLEGYKKALKDSGYPINEAYIKYCEHGGMIMEEVESSINELFSLQTRPDAILTASDRLSTNTMEILKRKGIRIPNDIGMIGFTNSLHAEIFNPSLSAVVQPAFEMGRKATELIIAQLESKRPVTQFEELMMDTQLIPRDSSNRPL